MSVGYAGEYLYDCQCNMLYVRGYFSVARLVDLLARATQSIVLVVFVCSFSHYLFNSLRARVLFLCAQYHSKRVERTRLHHIMMGIGIKDLEFCAMD